MEYQTPVEHINKVCDYLQTKGNILKRSGPYVRESDEETDEDETDNPDGPACNQTTNPAVAGAVGT